MVKELGGNSRNELSFPTPDGFSGGPVLLMGCGETIIPIGILYNNRTTQLSEWKLTEIEDGKTKYVEKALIVEQHALAHSIDDIEFALKEFM